MVRLMNKPCLLFLSSHPFLIYLCPARAFCQSTTLLPATVMTQNYLHCLMTLTKMRIL